MPRKTTAPFLAAGLALRRWRLKRNLTQQEAADLFDVSKRTFEGWEYGKLGPAHAKLMLAYLRLDDERRRFPGLRLNDERLEEQRNGLLETSV